MSDTRISRFVHPSFVRGSPDGTVYIQQKKVLKKLSVEIMDNSRDICINRCVKWVRIPVYALDICLFDIFHKDIVDAIIEAVDRGVRWVPTFILRFLHQNKYY